MAAGGSEEKLPTLRITFRELEERSKQLERTNTEYKRQIVSGRVDSKETVVQKSLEGRGIFHLKPTVIPRPTNRKDKKKSRKIHVNKLPSTSLTRTNAATDVPRDFPSIHGRSVYPVKQPESQTGFTEQRSKSTGNRHTKNGRRRKDEEEEVVTRSSRSSQMRSKSAGDQPRRGYDIKSELRGLVAEWDLLDNRRVERTLNRWNGDVTKLSSVFEMW